MLGFLWDRGVCAPYAQNVLIHALYLAVTHGYTGVHIVGAGFSFHDQIHVDQATNQFLKKRQHMYGYSEEVAYTDWRKVDRALVQSEYFALYNAFRVLRSVNEYAVSRGAHIINWSNYSYLDMFSRPSKSTEKNL